MPVVVSENQLAFYAYRFNQPTPLSPGPSKPAKTTIDDGLRRSIGYFIARAEGQKCTLQTPRRLSRLHRPTRTPHPLPTHWGSSPLLVSTATVPQFGRAARGHLRWPHATLSSSELSPLPSPPRGGADGDVGRSERRRVRSQSIRTSIYIATDAATVKRVGLIMIATQILAAHDSLPRGIGNAPRKLLGEGEFLTARSRVCSGWL